MFRTKVATLYKVQAAEPIGGKSFNKQTKKLVLEFLHKNLPASAKIQEKIAFTNSIYISIEIPANTFSFLDPKSYFEDKTYSGELMKEPITIGDYFLLYKIRISDHTQKEGGGMRYTGEDFERTGEANIDLSYKDFCTQKPMELKKYVENKLVQVTEDLNDSSFVKSNLR